MCHFDICATGPTGPAGITTDTQNALTITENGTYKVDYYFSGSTNTNANVTVEIKQNTTTYIICWIEWCRKDTPSNKFRNCCCKEKISNLFHIMPRFNNATKKSSCRK